MSACNFSNHFYPTLGMIADPDTSSEAIEYARENYLEPYENDPNDDCYISDDELERRIINDEQMMLADYYQDAKTIVEHLNHFMQDERVNPLAKFDTMLITSDLQTGYHDGFRIEIVNECLDNYDRYTLKSYYSNNLYMGGYQHPQDLPSGMTFEQFKACHDKAEAFAQYAIKELAKHLPFNGVSGGWTGGSYKLDDNTEAEHERFAAPFAELLDDIKQAGLSCL